MAAKHDAVINELNFKIDKFTEEWKRIPPLYILSGTEQKSGKQNTGFAIRA